LTKYYNLSFVWGFGGKGNGDFVWGGKYREKWENSLKKVEEYSFRE